MSHKFHFETVVTHIVSYAQRHGGQLQAHDLLTGEALKDWACHLQHDLPVAGIAPQGRGVDQAVPHILLLRSRKPTEFDEVAEVITNAALVIRIEAGRSNDVVRFHFGEV